MVGRDDVGAAVGFFDGAVDGASVGGTCTGAMDVVRRPGPAVVACDDVVPASDGSTHVLGSQHVAASAAVHPA